MKSVWILASKDLKVLLRSSQLWILLGLCSIIWGALFFNYILRYVEMLEAPFNNQKLTLHWSVVSQHIFSNHFILLFFIPALTMKALAEEKKIRTYELLLTSPITSYQIILSKFLSSFFIVTLFIFLSLIPFFWLDSVTYMDRGLLYSSLLGLFLLSGLYIAIGLFSSSLTSSHLVSLITAVLLNVFILMIGELGYSVESPLLSRFFDAVAVERYFISFMRGAIELKAVVFLLTSWVFFLFLSDRVIESSRWR